MVRTRREFARDLSAALAAGALVAAPSAAEAAENLEWSAGSPGGSWFTIVTGLAAIVMEKQPGLNIRIVPGGGRDNPSKIEAGVSQIGMGIDFLAAAAMKGEDPYDRPHRSLRSMGGTFAPAEFHVLVPVDEARPLDQLLSDRRLRVGTSQRATSEELTLRRALAFYRNSPSDMESAGGRYIATTYTQLVAAFQDGQIDVVFAAGSGRTGVALEIESGRRASKLIAFPPALMDYLSSTYGYGKGEILADTYSRIQQGGTAVPVTTLEAVILVGAGVSEDTVYRMVKTLIENRSRFSNIHQVLTKFDPRAAWRNQPVPLHPGAERAYRELGFMS